MNTLDSRHYIRSIISVDAPTYWWNKHRVGISQVNNLMHRLGHIIPNLQDYSCKVITTFPFKWPFS